MCGRYLAKNPDEMRRRFPNFDFGGTFAPRYNVAPTQSVLIAKNDGTHVVTCARWGLLPSWAASLEAQKVQPINAKTETLAESRMFAPLLRLQRCLIFADGFYEWRAAGKRKIPQLFTIAGNVPFAFAGLWDSWRDRIVSCTIITTEANALVAPIHARMPVLLDPDDAERWIMPNAGDPQTLLPMLRPYPAAAMEVREVSPALDSDGADAPESLTSPRLPF